MVDRSTPPWPPSIRPSRIGDERYHAEAEALSAAMLSSYFRNVPSGYWHDRLDLNDAPTGSTVPASSLYHLWTAVADLLKLHIQSAVAAQVSTNYSLSP